MQSQKHTVRTFQCTQRAGSDEWLVAFNDRFSFHAIASKYDLDSLFSRFSTVVLVGVFDWSNYSRDVFRDMATDDTWFSDRQIGVGVVCLENPAQLESINGAAHAKYMHSNTEPMLFRFVEGELKSTLAGPQPLVEIKRWLEPE
jgi:hypothetical protein